MTPKPKVCNSSTIKILRARQNCKKQMDSMLINVHNEISKRVLTKLMKNIENIDELRGLVKVPAMDDGGVLVVLCPFELAIRRVKRSLGSKYGSMPILVCFPFLKRKVPPFDFLLGGDIRIYNKKWTKNI